MIKTQQPSTDQPILTVSNLNKLVHDLLENQFPSIWVEGEISNFTANAASGHWYFTLKDANAQVSCAMFRFANQKLSFTPKHGQKVLVHARVSLYQNRGNFQLIIDHLEEAGFGALQHTYEMLKKKLSEEGLFDEAHKKALPLFPKCIGVVTSPTGAAIRDILTVLNRRYPLASVIIYPTPVQGDTAAPKIAKAIEIANQRHECDVLIVGRGGGSLEDLWPFNEEIVARAIYASVIPVVSSVGHEIDFTISDYVADKRAPTPSAAAEIVSPDQIKLKQQLKQHYSYLYQKLNQQLKEHHQTLDVLKKRLERAHPIYLLQQQSQQLDYAAHQLRSQIKQILEQKKSRWLHLSTTLQQFHPRHRLEHMQYQLNMLGQKCERSVDHRFQMLQARFQTLARTLQAMSPLAILARGYSVITDANGCVVKNAHQVHIGDAVQAKLHQGTLECEVIKSIDEE
ncbi:MAG: exodeoxyribonuclease VII large subunit [Gammaproteobacteria bacterium]|nr:exodeoxyribonuclease VII large subunit [Gammaproteobacteria bacterium]